MDTGGAQAGGSRGEGDFTVALAWVAVPALVCIAAPVHVRHRHPERYGGALAASRFRALSRVHGVARVPLLTPRPRADPRLGVRARPAPSPARTCSSSIASSPSALASRRRWTSPRRDRHRAAARGDAALGRLADGRARAAVHRVHVGGPHLPEVLSHKGVSVSRTHVAMWLTTEGVFGIALGVSTGTISSTCYSARCSIVPVAATT